MLAFKIIELLVNACLFEGVDSVLFADLEFVKLFPEVNSFFYSFVNTNEFFLGLIFGKLLFWLKSESL